MLELLSQLDPALAPVQELTRRLQLGWLTPIQLLVPRLHQMSPAETRECPQDLLEWVFSQLEQLEYAQLVACELLKAARSPEMKTKGMRMYRLRGRNG